jgi:gliding motility-associated-like protein
MMRTFTRSIYILLLLFKWSVSYAQVYCPPNIDFEQGAFTNWNCYTGSCCPIGAMNSSVPLGNRHTLMTGPGVDPYGGFPVVAPGGGLVSLKLGNSINGREAERVRYTITIPDTDYYFLQFRFAVVLQDPSHPFADQPRFEVTVRDPATNQPLSCLNYTYVASSNLPGFRVSPLSTPADTIIYKPWDSVGINLTDYANQTLHIDFTTGDCNLGHHFGYAYLDINCGDFEVYHFDCNVGDSIDLQAPPGYQSYIWRDQSFSNVVGNARKIRLKKPLANTHYYMILQPYAGFGCQDTIKIPVRVPSASLGITAQDTVVCHTNAARIHTQLNSSNTNYPYTYTWWPATGLSCINCQSPVALATGNTVYNVAVTDACGLTDTTAANVYFGQPMAFAKDTVACPGDTIRLTAWSNNTTGIPVWSPSQGLINAITDTPTIVVNTPRTYQYMVTDIYGCKDTANLNVTFAPVPVAYAGRDTLICGGYPHQLNATGGVMYKWWPNYYINATNIANPIVRPPVRTEYRVIVSNGYSCSDTDTVVVETRPRPVADAGADTGACYGQVVTLKGNGGHLYHWFPEPGLANPNASQQTITVYETKQYYLVVTNQHGCNDTDIVNIVRYPDPDANAGNDTTVCPGSTLRLRASGGIEYQWQQAEGLTELAKETIWAEISKPVVHTVVVKNVYGCVDTASVNIRLLPEAFEVQPVREICKGDSIQLLASGAEKYTWSSSDMSTAEMHIANPVLRPAVSASLKVHMVDMCGREAERSVDVVVHQLPVIEAFAREKDCGEETGLLLAKGAKEYSWWPVDGVLNPSVGTTPANPGVTTTYVVTGIDEYGCVSTDTTELKVYEGEGRVIAPDAFTPNGDGLNDCYRVMLPGVVHSFELCIADRFGNIVFRTNDMNACWDGTYKGVPAELSTYGYYYKANTSVCPYVFRKGNLTLIR